MKKVRKHLGAKKVSDLINRRRMRYIGHIIRYPRQRWVNKGLAFNAGEATKIDGRNTRTTWRKNMANLFEKLELKPSDCLDRELWKSISGGQKFQVENPNSKRRRKVIIN